MYCGIWDTYFCKLERLIYVRHLAISVQIKPQMLWVGRCRKGRDTAKSFFSIGSKLNGESAAKRPVSRCEDHRVFTHLGQWYVALGE